MANRFQLLPTSSDPAVDPVPLSAVGTVPPWPPEGRPLPSRLSGAPRPSQAQFLDAAMDIIETERMAVGSATYFRLWRIYQGLRDLAYTAPRALRFLASPAPGDGVWEPAAERNCRDRMSLAVQFILAQGFTRADLRRDVDRQWAVEWFLMLCAAPEDRRASTAGVDQAVFDLFWRGIAAPVNARRKAS